MLQSSFLDIPNDHMFVSSFATVAESLAQTMVILSGADITRSPLKQLSTITIAFLSPIALNSSIGLIIFLKSGVSYLSKNFVF